MKLLALALLLAIGFVQYPLWLGKGGWLRVWEIDRQLGVQRATNQKLQSRNAVLDAEVQDLKQGVEAVVSGDFGPNAYIRVKPACPSGGAYTINPLGTDAVCSLPEHAP